VGRLAADLVPLAVGPVVAERLPALAGQAAIEERKLKNRVKSSPKPEKLSLNSKCPSIN